MTHDELIQKAIEHLRDSKVASDRLTSPHIRDAAVVYFQIRPHSNCMVVMDSETGERLTSHFGPDPFLQEYQSHCWLPREARSLAKEVREGLWDGFTELAIEPETNRAQVLRELERRCPGLPRTDYEKALAEAESKG